MYKKRIGSFFFALMCLLKLASLHYVDDERCIFQCSENNSIKMESTYSKDQANISDDIRQIRQNRTYEVKNVTLKEKSGTCCNDSSSAESLIKTLGEPATISIPDLYKTSNYSTNWYKDCKEYVKNRSEISFNSVQQADSAVFVYTITHMYNGGNDSVCGKKWLIVKAEKKESRGTQPSDRLKRQGRRGRGQIQPKIKGVGNETITEVEIGQNHTMPCEAAVDNGFVQLYWVKTNKTEIEDLNDLLDYCSKPISKTCMVKKESTNSNLRVDLHLININEDDIKYPYKCKLDSIKGKDMRLFVLKLKDKSKDISKKAFTTSIIASITCSVSIVLLIGLCILFRIDIVLLYRSLTGVDETIGDGKEYDAYLSSESFSTSESDERKFAFQTLAPILENSFAYKLCIFERDAVPGGAAVDDMNLFLEKSRRLIVILNKDTNTSCKAMYELESGLHKAMVERKIKIILIEFTPSSGHSFQLESLNLLKMKNRVKWKGDQSCPLNSQFWKKMQYLMPVKPVKLRSSKSYVDR